MFSLEVVVCRDLAFCGESVKEVTEKYEKWKEKMEGKSLCLNVGKNKGMQLLDGKMRLAAKIDPCGVCGERAGCNSIKCLLFRCFTQSQSYCCM